MQFRVRDDGASVHVALEGQLNFAANEDFQVLLGQLASHKNKKVVFDMTGLSHIDSVGLGLLYIAREDMAEGGASIVLAHPRDNVLRMLQLTEAHKTFEIQR
ncbi:anti-sigma factor antagonist [Paramagnetospirillum kuznetsovii]|uniref:Anti-sigma factor antagonist n=1 Tax=Paramagnetospirillum kuznetsovii TaxID=2053833 RepID=A0A364NUF1_9PROT|nr:STAS domain-containing protein [Paramagnetospirillum kuznetsovii]RAU20696.1 anti-sigma factor antagonist [Paramagnetospirillum kuznetsovii]